MICPLDLSSWMPLSPNSYLNFLSSNTSSGSPLWTELIPLLPHQSTSFCILKFCQCITNIFPLSVGLNNNYASASSKEVFFFFFRPGHAAPRTLVLQPGTEPGPLAVKVPSPNHWTARELQVFFNRCQGLNPGILFKLVWVGDKHEARFLSSSGDHDTSQVEKYGPYQFPGSDGCNMEPLRRPTATTLPSRCTI